MVYPLNLLSPLGYAPENSKAQKTPWVLSDEIKFYALELRLKAKEVYKKMVEIIPPEPQRGSRMPAWKDTGSAHIHRRTWKTQGGLGVILGKRRVLSVAGAERDDHAGDTARLKQGNGTRIIPLSSPAFPTPSRPRPTNEAASTTKHYLLKTKCK